MKRRTPKGNTPTRNFGRVSDKDWSMITKAAKAAGMSRTQWMLFVLMRTVQKKHLEDAC